MTLRSDCGTTLLCSAFGIDPSLLKDYSLLERACRQALQNDSYTIVGKADHHFTPHGYTLIFLLAESHLALHTYPEYNSLTITLYTCRGPGEGTPVIESILRALCITLYTLSQHAVPFSADALKTVDKTPHD